jgi:hypothetical protein
VNEPIYVRTAILSCRPGGPIRPSGDEVNETTDKNRTPKAAQVRPRIRIWCTVCEKWVEPEWVISNWGKRYGICPCHPKEITVEVEE